MRYGDLVKINTWDNNPSSNLEPVEVEVTLFVDKNVLGRFIEALKVEPIERLISVEKNSKNGAGEA